MGDAGTNADIDSALAATLAEALASGDEENVGRTKSAIVLRHRDAIAALVAKDWSWERIAARLRKGGLDVSARTVRLVIKPTLGAQKKGKKSAGNGKAVGRKSVTHTPPIVSKKADGAARTETEHVATPRTETSFFRTEDVDN